jgi:hypothetical protein
MKKIVGFLLLMLIVQSGYGQLVEQCFTINGYSESFSSGNGYFNTSLIKANASKEIVMIGGNKIFRVTKEGSKLWDRTLINYFRDYSIDNEGNVYALHDNGRRFIKINSNNSVAWEKSINGVTFLSHEVDVSRNAFVTGYNASTFKYFFTRYLPNGSESWTVNHDGYAGTFKTNDIGESYLLVESSINRFLIIKYSAVGNQIWSRQYDLGFYPSNLDYNYTKLFLDNDGYVYIVLDYWDGKFLVKLDHRNGNFIDYASLDIFNSTIKQGPNALYLLGQDFFNDNQLIKLDYNFSSITLRRFNQIPDYYYSYKDIVVDDEENVAVLFPTYNTNSSETGNYFSIINKQGQLLYSKTFYQQEFTTGIIIDEAGSYFLPTLTECLKRFSWCENVIPAAIQVHPNNSIVCEGSSAHFSVTASGTGLLYQWRKGNQVLSNDNRYSGVNSPTLTIVNANAAEDAGSYSCEIFDICDRKITSNAATLGFTALTSITSQPTNITQCSGTQAVFRITISGGQNVAFQWRKGGTIINDGGNITGTKTNTLTINNISAADAAEYWCEVTSTCFTTPIISQKGVLAVLQSATVTAQPQAVSSCSGTSVTFAVQAAGAGLTYQWRKDGVNLNESATATGTKSNLLTLSSITAASAGQYTCVVTGACGSAVTSAAAPLIVSTAPQITTQPTSQSVCAGQTVNFSVAASGSSLTYVWRRGSTIITNGGKFSGATTATLTITNVAAGEEGAYTCTISNPCGADLITTAAQLTVGAVASITAKSADVTTCTDQVVSMNVTATGSQLTYQWKRNGTVITNNARISGATSAQLIINKALPEDAGNYTCDVTASCGSTQVSGIVRVTIQDAVAITSQPAAQVVCNSAESLFSVSVSGTVQSYRWKRNGVNLNNSTRITGATSANLTIRNTSQQDAGLYTCEIVTACGTLITQSARLDVNPAPDLVLITPVSCDPFITEWSSIVQDNNNVFGQYFIFEKGSSTPLPGLGSATKAGLYIIVKTNGVCADSVEWENTCVITGLERMTEGFTLYPNPAADRVVIDYPAIQRILVYDSKGALLETFTFLPSDQEFSMDVSAWTEGLYQLIGFTRDDRMINAKLVIRR